MVQPQRPALGARELEFATFHEGYVSRYIQLADAKAGTTLVAAAGTLGYFLGQTEFVNALLLKGTPLACTMAILTGVLLAGSGAASFAVISPRRSKNGHGLVYFGDVAEKSASAFIDGVALAGEDGIARERLQHTHAIAVICAKKYSWLRTALVVGGLGLVAALLSRLLI